MSKFTDNERAVIEHQAAVGIHIVRHTPGSILWYRDVCDRCGGSGQLWQRHTGGQPNIFCGECMMQYVSFPDDPALGGTYHQPSPAEARAQAQADHQAFIDVDRLIADVSRDAMEQYGGKRMGDAAYRDIPEGADDGPVSSGFDEASPRRPTPETE